MLVLLRKIKTNVIVKVQATECFNYQKQGPNFFSKR